MPLKDFSKQVSDNHKKQNKPNRFQTLLFAEIWVSKNPGFVPGSPPGGLYFQKWPQKKNNLGNCKNIKNHHFLIKMASFFMHFFWPQALFRVPWGPGPHGALCVYILYKVFFCSKRGPEVLFHASLKTSNMVTGGLQKALCNHGSVLNECGLATFYKMIFSSDPLWKVSMIEFLFTMWWVLLTSKEKLDLKQFWRLLPSITKIRPHFLVFGVSIINL